MQLPQDTEVERKRVDMAADREVEQREQYT